LYKRNAGESAKFKRIDLSNLFPSVLDEAFKGENCSQAIAKGFF
jgi:hypothetical protein